MCAASSSRLRLLAESSSVSVELAAGVVAVAVVVASFASSPLVGVALLVSPNNNDGDEVVDAGADEDEVAAPLVERAGVPSSSSLLFTKNWCTLTSSLKSPRTRRASCNSSPPACFQSTSRVSSDKRTEVDAPRDTTTGSGSTDGRGEGDADVGADGAEDEGGDDGEGGVVIRRGPMASR
mmetsp:Transcript_33987/g.57085  ORF Transcript_33987/g.57085 Transcript_33987/m.57085 type:complete len:180 (-) Transcript_33987:333-872(-)